MKFAKAERTQLPHRKSMLYCSFYLAAFFVATAVGQLFAFEQYPAIIESYGIAWMGSISALIAALLAVSGVFAVPSLLLMPLSPLMRALSRVCAWLVLVYWLIVGLWQNLSSLIIPNAGLFGVHVQAPHGWWLVTYIVILMLLLGYVTFGDRILLRKNKT